MKTHARKSEKKAAATKIIKEICAECGYSAVVRGAKCPMCLPCPRCGRKLMQCVCIEGE